MKNVFGVILLSYLLAACVDDDGNIIDTAPICHALIAPLKYNTYKVTSGRYAGKTLALDIKQRNEIWDKLECKTVKAK